MFFILSMKNFDFALTFLKTFIAIDKPLQFKDKLTPLLLCSTVLFNSMISVEYI